MLAGLLGVRRDRSRGREVEIALQRKSQRAAGGSELVQAHVAEFRLAEPEIAKTERQIDVGVELGQEPGGVAVGGEELDDGLEVEGLVLSVDGGALGASVLEELFALSGSDKLHVFDSCLGGPQRSVHQTHGLLGSAPSRTQLINGRSERFEAAPAVTAALRWRGRCGFRLLASW
jgi:hypothetical protein